jgi:hypothetical protein
VLYSNTSWVASLCYHYLTLLTTIRSDLISRNALIVCFSMLQNPMVQQMLRNDPRFANNPQMQQAMEGLATNPAMASQMSRMMQDPAMMQQMQAMMQQNGGQLPMPGGMGGGGMPGGGFGAPGGNAPAQPGAGANRGQQPPSGANDEATTEEEMIAEAIRRSLQDGN